MGAAATTVARRASTHKMGFVNTAVPHAERVKGMLPTVTLVKETLS